MNRPYRIGFALVLLLLGSLGVAVAFGSTEVAFLDVYRVLLYRLLGLGTPPGPVVTAIVWELRLPRALLAMVVGGGLAVIGVAMQTLVRNPLAEPYILGVSSGASVGASLFYLGFLPPLLSRTLTMPLAAFLGALAAITIVFLVARSGTGGLSTVRLLLAGVAVSALLSSVTSFVTYASPEPNKVQTVLFWLLGSFAGARWPQVGLALSASGGALLVLGAAARPLDAMLLGEEQARHLGVSVEVMKRLLIVLTAFVTGTLVAYSGIIGFVGLIVPHAVRFVAGASHRRVVPLSYVAGAIFLVWADLAARSLLASELPVGILTALCGVPFFLVLLRWTRYGAS